MTSLSDNVAIFWDYENCPLPSNTSGYAVANAITSIARPYGKVRLFKAYLEIADQLLLRSELHSSGVTLVDCPHNGRKDVADKMILVDMLMYAIDNPTPCTIIVISGDRDFAYALSMLKVRHWQMVLVTLPNAHASLTSQASLRLDWATTISNPKIRSKPATFMHSSANMGAVRRMGPPPAARSDCGSISNPSNFAMPVSKPATIKFFQTPSHASSVVDPPIAATPAADVDHLMPLPEVLDNKLDCFSEVFSHPVQATLINDSQDSCQRDGELLDDAFPDSEAPEIYTERDSGEMLERLGVEDHPPLTLSPPSKQLELGTAAHDEPSPDLGFEQASPIFPTVNSVPEDDQDVAHKGDDNLSSVSPEPEQPERSGLSSLSHPASVCNDTPTYLDESILDAHGEVSANQGPTFGHHQYASDDWVRSPGALSVSEIPHVSEDPSALAEFPGLENDKLQSPQEESPPWNLSSISPSPEGDLSHLPGPPPQRQVPLHFVKLVQVLQAHKNQGELRPSRSDVALQLGANIYHSAGVNKFGQYVDLAVAQTIVKIGCKKNRPWIGLQPDWYNAIPAIPEPQIIPSEFITLVQTLQMFRHEGFSRSFNSQIAGYIPKAIYQQVGVKKFGQYIDLAATRGIVKTGGTEGQEWITLQSKWRNAVPSVE